MAKSVSNFILFNMPVRVGMEISLDMLIVSVFQIMLVDADNYIALVASTVCIFVFILLFIMIILESFR